MLASAPTPVIAVGSVARSLVKRLDRDGASQRTCSSLVWSGKDRDGRAFRGHGADPSRMNLVIPFFVAVGTERGSEQYRERSEQTRRGGP